MIKYLSSYVPVKTLDQISKMYVRPHFDFCDVIYPIPEIDSLFVTSSRLSYWMNRIERLQYQAALAVTGAWQGTNTDKIYEELAVTGAWQGTNTDNIYEELAVTGAWQGTNTDNIYEELGVTGAWQGTNTDKIYEELGVTGAWQGTNTTKNWGGKVFLNKGGGFGDSYNFSKSKII